MDPVEAIRSFGERRREVFVGFSGGADSTALLLALVQEMWKVVAVHFNHHLRGAAADADEAWCRAFCKERGIALKVISLQVNEARRTGEGVEECARRLRLEAWEKLVRPSPKPIFLAHHADDCLEELFLRLGRGANCTGLTSLRPRRQLEKLTLWRPLLGCRKAELEEWLRGQGVCDWRIDQTNLESEGSRRNAIRNQLLPLAREIFGTDAGFFAALQSLRDDAEHLEQEADKLLEDKKKLKDSLFWRNLPSALFPRVFRKWAGMALPPSRATIERIVQTIDAFESALVPLGGGWMLRVSPFTFRVICPEKKTKPRERKWDLWMWAEMAWSELGDFSQFHPGHVHFPLEGCAEAFDGDLLPRKLTLRTWRAGDKMVPFGSTHHKKVSDLFQEHHIIPEDRDRYPLVCAEEEIIWIPGICRANFAPVRKSTTSIVELRFTFFNKQDNS